MKKTFKCMTTVSEFGKLNGIFAPYFQSTTSEEVDMAPSFKACFCDMEHFIEIKRDDKFIEGKMDLECTQNDDGTYNIDVPMMGKFTTLKNILSSEVIE